MTVEKHAWLMKSEPDSYGISHLKRDKKTAWTGVRNFQARNYMQSMQVGNPILFYHSSCKVPGVYGLAKVASKPYADPTQFEKGGHYYDSRATQEKPIWFLVDIAFVKEFEEPVTLTEIRDNPKLKSMMILQQGSRLSVTPVDMSHYEIISSLAK